MQNLGLLIYLVAMAIVVAIFIAKSRAGKLPSIRKLAALDAIEEGVGRAVEMGKPISYFLAGQLSGSARASGPLASLGVLDYVAKLAVKKDVKMIVIVNYTDTTALAMEVLRSAYTAEGKQEQFNPYDQVKFFDAAAGADKVGVSGILLRERPAMSLLMGDISAEAVLVADMSVIAGSLTISGCQRETQLPFLVAFSDYSLVGEELLVAGAYLTHNPTVLGSVEGQDAIKISTMVIGLAGAIMTTAGTLYIKNFFQGW